MAKNYANLSKSEKQLLMEIYYLPGHCVSCHENFAITQLCDLGMLECPDDGLYIGNWTANGVELSYMVTDQAIELINKERSRRT